MLSVLDSVLFHIFFFYENPLIINDFNISFERYNFIHIPATESYSSHIFSGSENIKKCSWVNCGHLTSGHLVTNASKSLNSTTNFENR